MDTVKFKKKNVKTVAHRGLSGLERENTCPAFLAAATRSYFGIETDVHATADGVFVVVHDETLSRVSNGNIGINVETSRWDDFKDVILPDIDGTTVRRDIKVPLLSEYISLCKKYQKVCVLELKNTFSMESISKMVEEIFSLGYLDSMIFISFSFDNCVNLRQLLPDAKIQFLTDKEIDEKLVKSLEDNRLDLDIYFKRLDKKAVKLLHSKGIEVNCWTVDQKDTAEALVKMGVDYITTNILE